MDSFESALEAFIKSEALRQGSVGSGIKLRERQAQMSVEITADGMRLIALNLDKIGHLSAMREGLGLDRICDFLVVGRIGETSHAVFIELKKTFRPSDDSTEQLRRSLPILKYLVSVVEVAREENLVGLDVRYALICERISDRLDKQRVKVKKNGLIESENWKSITVNKFLGSRLNFRDLISTQVSMVA